MRTAPRVLPIVLLAALAAGCATPVGVERVDEQVVQRSLTASVLSTGHPSAFSMQTLSRLGLRHSWQEDPPTALAGLREGLPDVADASDRLFALAELSFTYGTDKRDRSQMVAAALYAYAFLFPEEGSPPGPLDPRQRLAADLYNRALVAGLGLSDGAEKEIGAGTLALPFGTLELDVAPDAYRWSDEYRLVRFTDVARLEVRGLRNRYRRPGIGAPLAASVAPVDPEAADQAALRIGARTKVAVTALLRVDEPRHAVASGIVHGRLEIDAADVTERVSLDGRDVPLETERSSALAYQLQGSPIWDFGLRGYLSGSYGSVSNGLWALNPYRPGRIPVIFIHGTASSPARWAEMVNELEADPLLRGRYQFWLFMYNTGNPIVYSAMVLRESLARALAEEDPKGRDPALRRIVLIGHSQGGLLARLLVTESGNRFWDAAMDEPIDELDVSDRTRDLLRRALFFEPFPAVRRVIFIATPHGGSYLAAERFGRFAAGLVSMPVDVARTGAEILQDSPRGSAIRELGRIPSSVDNMSPRSGFVKALAASPMSPEVTLNSIIPVKGNGPLEDENDGVVRYTSAHIEGVESEKIVHSGHSTQGQPATIEEVRRILREHLVTP